MKKFLVFLCAMFIGASYADTETIKWYVDGNVYNTTTCQSGGDVNMPAAPTKAGYTFQGWVVALYDFSTLDYTVDGTGHTQNAPAWTTTFEYGLVSGVSLCSVTNGSFAVSGTPDTETADGQNCWCKATGYKPAGSNIVYENVSSSPWAFLATYGSASNCATACANFCGLAVQDRSALRAGLFGSVTPN